MSQLNHLRLLLSAAGYKNLGSTSGGGEPERIQFEDPQSPGVPRYSFPLDSVEAFLRQENRYPEPALIRCATIEESMVTQQARIRHLEDQAAANTYALAVALRKKLFLCYVEEIDDTSGNAWFTTDMVNQTGDDWNDAPYQHNAGSPYDFHRTWGLNSDLTLTPPRWPAQPYLLIQVRWEGVAFRTAAFEGFNGSVDDINQGRLYWLYYGAYREDIWSAVRAGTSLRDFMNLVVKLKGRIVWPQPINREG